MLTIHFVWLWVCNMKLGVYFKTLCVKERKKFIAEVATSLNKNAITVRSYINGNRNIQPVDAKKIAESTGGEVRISELCPDVFEEAT